MPPFFVITAAYNAAETIEKTIRSVLSQSAIPIRWIIVDDGSTDRTVDIVGGAAEKHSFVELIRLVNDDDSHSFGSKVRALNHAVAKLDLLRAEFVGVLDSDVELPDGYFEKLLGRMAQDKTLGVAGGVIRPFYDGAFHDRIQNSQWSVAGAVQIFKTQCFLDVGARFLELPYGSEDAAMEIMARFKGWSIRTYEDLPVTHYGKVGVTAGSYLKARFRRGVSHASIGYHPLFHLARCVGRFREYPWVFGSIYELIGYWAGRYRYRTPVLNIDAVAFLRREQLSRLIRHR